MAKKIKKNNPAPSPAAPAKQVKEEVKKVISVDTRFPAWLSDFRIQAAIVAILAFVFYCNSFNNEFALDDTIVIIKNEYVTEGFSGIKSIMTKDAFDSYYRQNNSQNQLAGGRYRPLSIVTFAIEQQFLGTDSVSTGDGPGDGLSFEMKSPREKKLLHDMHVRHVVNVLLYMVSVVVLLYFLRFIVFRNNMVMALIATVLFTIHPLHTEVVANVKSRDEILSLLFICLTFIYAFKYQEEQKKWMLGASLVCYLLAFLSKEYAITVMLLLPLSLHLFNKYPIGKSIKATLPYIAVIVVYILLRLQVITPANPDSDFDILNNPYALATPVEKIATEIATTLNYLKLLIFPHPLSVDYAYKTIAYKTFTHPLVWLSILVHVAIIRGLFYYYKRNSIVCFGIAFYLFHLLLICNLIFNIGATMGERLIYHSSVGFAIVVAYLLVKGVEKIKLEMAGKAALAAFMTIVIVLSGFKTIERNANWKNDDVLFNHDINTVPNSALVNSNVGYSYLNRAETEKDSVKKKQLLHKAIGYYDKAISIHTTFVSSYMNRGIAYFYLNEPDSAKYNYDMVIKYYPNYAKIHEIYYNLGVNFYFHKRIPEAIEIWKKVVKMKPDYTLAQQSINTAEIELRNAAAQKK